MMELNFPDRIWMFGILFGIFLLQLAAFFSPPFQIVAGVASTFLSLVALAVLGLQGAKTLKLSKYLSGQLNATPDTWRNSHAAILKGLRSAIEGEFQRWGLSSPEKRVALQLIGGANLKEIAASEQTSEREAHALSTSVYLKSGLNGRYALSDYFLGLTKSLK